MFKILHNIWMYQSDRGTCRTSNQPVPGPSCNFIRLSEEPLNREVVAKGRNLTSILCASKPWMISQKLRLLVFNILHGCVSKAWRIPLLLTHFANCALSTFCFTLCPSGSFPVWHTSCCTNGATLGTSASAATSSNVVSLAFPFSKLRPVFTLFPPTSFPTSTQRKKSALSLRNYILQKR